MHPPATPTNCLGCGVDSRELSRWYGRGYCPRCGVRRNRLGLPMSPSLKIPLSERVRISTEGKHPAACWPWFGYVDAKGYANTGKGPAPRFVWLRLVGPIPPGLEIDHLCHTEDLDCEGGVTCQHRQCVNPAHLRLVTKPVNLARRKRVTRPTCSTGKHPKTDQFGYRNSRNVWHCSPCKNRQSRDSKRRKAAERRSSAGQAQLPSDTTCAYRVPIAQSSSTMLHE